MLGDAPAHWHILLGERLEKAKDLLCAFDGKRHKKSSCIVCMTVDVRGLGL
jgi:hypothetical protein